MADANSGNWLVQRYRNLRNKIQRRDVFRQTDIEQRFTRVYELNYWGDDESRSGSGSTMEYTEGVRASLPDLVQKFGIRSMFDAPCGDFNWMRTLRGRLPLTYIGGDIVKPLIDANQTSYGNEDTRFIHSDITRDPMPPVDLWFCRDCLFHLSFADARRAFENFMASNIPYALLTSHIAAGDFVNDDITTGDFRPIVLFDKPYCLPTEMLASFDDFVPPDQRRIMGLWSREQIGNAMGIPL